MFRKNDQHLQQSFFSGLNELPAKLQKRLADSWAGTFYDEFFCRIDETPYAVLYADSASRPNIPVNILVALEVLKDGHGWSDEEMYENFCYNVQVRHALGLSNLGEGHFELRTLYNFRQRLTAHMEATGENLLAQTFEQISDEQLARFELKSLNQRVDSTQIASNIRRLSRLQLLVTVLQRTHRMLSPADQTHWQADFVPYLQGSAGQYTWRLKGQAAYDQHLQAIGDLMARLVTELAPTYQEQAAYQLLVRVFAEHFQTTADDGIDPKDGADLGADSLQSPDDPEATFRRKRGEAYVGYVANITETSVPDNDFQLILKVQVEPNITDDAQMLADIIPDLKARTDLKLVDADGGYGSPAVDEVLAEHDVELRQTALRGRAPAAGAFNLADGEWELAPETNRPLTVTLPNGERLTVEPGRKADRFIIRPPEAKPIYFSRQELAVALRRQRSRQPLPDGKNPRAAVEATIAAIKRPFGNDKAPVRGKFRLAMMVIGSAAMVNLRRIQRFRTEQRQEMRKNAAETGGDAPLLSFFSRSLVTAWHQFCSAIRFSYLHS
jgi:hypothetical protein